MLSEGPIIIQMNITPLWTDAEARLVPKKRPVLERMLAEAKQNLVLASRSTTMSADDTTLEQARPGYPSGALYAVEVRN